MDLQRIQVEHLMAPLITDNYPTQLTVHSSA